MSTSSEKDDYNLPLHIAAVFIEIGVSFLGTSLPLIGRRASPKASRVGALLFALAKNFGTGVILATGFVHMLSPAMECLSDPRLPKAFSEDYDAFACLFALAAVLTLQFVQSLATQHAHSHAKQSRAPLLGERAHVQDKATPSQGEEASCCATGGKGSEEEEEEEEEGGHVHTLLLERDNARKVSVYLLELGIATHSVIIGITLGVARGNEFKGLLAALAFHQFFEGIGLATTVLDSGFRSLLQPIFVIVFYTLTTPLGIAIGIGISQTYDEGSVSALLVQGTLDAISAGVLIYDGLVNMLTLNITQNKAFYKRSPLGKAALFFALWAGAAIMGLIGRWA